MKQPLISVILPAFNCEAFIEKAIDSILYQTYPHFELLIGNDGSTDKTLEKIHKYLGDKRVRLYNFERNSGKIELFNFLVSQAAGEFITTQDADDWSDHRRLEMQLNYLLENDEFAGCGTQVLKVDQHGNKLYRVYLPSSLMQISERIVQMREIFTPASILFRASVLKEFGGYRNFFKGICGEDEDLVLRVFEKYKLTNLEETLYFYRFNPFSLSLAGTNDAKKYLSFAFARRLHFERLSGRPDWVDANEFSEIEFFFESALLEIQKQPGKELRESAKAYFFAKEFKDGLRLYFKALKIEPFNISNIKIFGMFFVTLISPIHPIEVKSFIKHKRSLWKRWVHK